MINKKIWELLKQSSGFILIFSLCELYGGVFLGITISSMFDATFLNDNKISQNFFVAGLLFFILRSYLYFFANQKLLEKSFFFTKEIIDNQFNKVALVDSAETIESEKFLKNINHEAVSLQANGVTPTLFMVADAISISMLIGVALYFSWQASMIYLFVGVMGAGCWGVTSKFLGQLANERAEAEQTKIKLASSLIISKSLYLLSSTIFSLTKDFKAATSKSAQSGTTHQAIIQVPRIFLEVTIVVVGATLTISNVDISGDALLSLMIIIRTVPNLTRMLFNLGNLRAAQVSIDIISEAEESSYRKLEITENLEVITNENGISIATNSSRYPDIVNINLGLNILIGPSGIGKTVLMKSACIKLNGDGFPTFFFPRNLVDDDVLMTYLISRVKELIERDKLCDPDLLSELSDICNQNLDGQKLSTGECERIIIYYASTLKNRFVIMDEFFSNIPSKKQSKYFDMFQKSRGSEITVLISHDTNIISKQNISLITLSDGSFQRSKKLGSGGS